MEALAILFLILVAIPPFVTLFLLAKYRKLRADLEEARVAQSSEAASFRREITELKKQIASATPGLPPAGEKPVERPVAPAPAEKPVQQPGVPAAVPPREVSVPPPRVDFPRPVPVPPPAALPPQKASMP